MREKQSWEHADSTQEPKELPKFLLDLSKSVQKVRTCFRCSVRADASRSLIDLLLRTQEGQQVKDLKARVADAQEQLKERRGALAVFGKSKSFSGSSRGLAKASSLRRASTTAFDVNTS